MFSFIFLIICKLFSSSAMFWPALGSFLSAMCVYISSKLIILWLIQILLSSLIIVLFCLIEIVSFVACLLLNCGFGLIVGWGVALDIIALCMFLGDFMLCINHLKLIFIDTNGSF